MPSDRAIVIERFRDEIGDWRVCVLTPFGARVHAPWGLALTARLRDSLGLEVQSIWSDDGIALHLPDADTSPPLDDLMLEPDEVEDLVMTELGGSALFGARFRENAARALLIPRRRPGERTPLWQQRLKAQSLLQVARRYGSFPVVLETYRECLQDVFDLPALKQILRGLKTRELDLVDVETPSASPYSSSLLFDYIATYMYEDDTPPAERRAQALSLDRDLLRELLGQEELRDLLDADAVEEVERQLQGRRAERWTSCTTGSAASGDLRRDEYEPDQAEALLRERRAIEVRVGGDEVLVAAEDAGRYRDALGAMPPGGLPAAFLEKTDEPLPSLLLRYARVARPVHDGRGGGAIRPRARGRRGGAGSARARRQARPRRAAPRRDGARVVRSRCPPPPAPRFARGVAARGRADRAGGARPLPARLAGRRPPRDPARGARAAPGAPASRLALGVRAAASPRARATSRRSSTSCALRARSSGSARASTAWRSTSATTPRLLGRVASAERPEGDVHDRLREALSASAEFWFDLLETTGLEADRPSRRCGSSSGQAR